MESQGGFLEENSWIWIYDSSTERNEKRMCLAKDISVGMLVITPDRNYPISIQKIDYIEVHPQKKEEFPIGIPKGSLLKSPYQCVPFQELWIHPKQRLLAGNHIKTIPEIIKVLDADDTPFKTFSMIEESSSQRYIQIYLSEKLFFLVNGIWIQSF
jgi:hypothetical protein